MPLVLRSPPTHAAARAGLEVAIREIRDIVWSAWNEGIRSEFERATKARGDKSIDAGADVASLPSGLRSRIEQANRKLVGRMTERRIGSAVDAAGNEVQRASRANFDRQIGKEIGRRFRTKPRVGDALRSYRAAAVRQISSVRDSVIPTITKDVAHAYANGWDADRLAKHWEDNGLPVEYGTVEGRARVLATTELARLNSAVTREVHRSLGITQYAWRHSGKANFRPMHKSWDGKVFSWSKAPPGGHPGNQPGCGCGSDGVLSDRQLEQLALESEDGTPPDAAEQPRTPPVQPATPAAPVQSARAIRSAFQAAQTEAAARQVSLLAEARRVAALEAEAARVAEAEALARARAVAAEVEARAAAERFLHEEAKRKAAAAFAREEAARQALIREEIERKVASDLARHEAEALAMAQAEAARVTAEAQRKAEIERRHAEHQAAILAREEAAKKAAKIRIKKPKPDPASALAAEVERNKGLRRELFAKTEAALGPGARAELLELRARQVAATEGRAGVIPRGQTITDIADSQRQRDAWVASLTPVEKEAVFDWSREEWFRRMKLVDSGRGADEGIGFSEVDARLAVESERKMTEFREALAKAPRFEGKVSRGLRDLPKNSPLRKVLDAEGSIFELESVTSWSADEFEARGFAADDDGSYLLQVVTKQGAVISDNRIVNIADEVEVMIDKGARFRVVSSKKRKGDYKRRLVILEEIQ